MFTIYRREKEKLYLYPVTIRKQTIILIHIYKYVFINTTVCLKRLKSTEQLKIYLEDVIAFHASMT